MGGSHLFIVLGDITIVALYVDDFLITESTRVEELKENIGTSR